MSSQVVPIASVRKSGCQHPPFDAAYRPFFEKMSRTFAEVFPGSPAQWEDDFRRDSNPEREMAFWATMACLYEHFTSAEEMDLDQKREIFSVLVVAKTYGAKDALRFIKPRRLTRRQVRDVVSDLTNGLLHPLALV
jgi:hypothetical protein